MCALIQVCTTHVHRDRLCKQTRHQSLLNAMVPFNISGPMFWGVIRGTMACSTEDSGTKLENLRSTESLRTITTFRLPGDNRTLTTLTGIRTATCILSMPARSKETGRSRGQLGRLEVQRNCCHQARCKAEDAGSACL